MNTLETLIQARDLLARKNWCKRAFALDASGRSHTQDFFQGNQDVVDSYCALGALYAITGVPTEKIGEAERALQDALPHVAKCCDSILTFNDVVAKTKEDVLWLYDVAISNYRARQVLVAKMKSTVNTAPEVVSP